MQKLKISEPMEASPEIVAKMAEESKQRMKLIQEDFEKMKKGNRQQRRAAIRAQLAKKKEV